MRVGAALVGALYHPPRPQYSAESLLDYVESCVAELTRDHPTSVVVLAGDFNQLPHNAVVERTGLTQPTRRVNVLDRVYVSDPLHYSIVRVVKSTVRPQGRRAVRCATAGTPRQVHLCKVISYDYSQPALSLPGTHFFNNI